MVTGLVGLGIQSQEPRRPHVCGPLGPDTVGWGGANPMSHVDACVDRLNEGSWDPAVANTTAYLTGSVFSRESETVTCIVLI